MVSRLRGFALGALYCSLLAVFLTGCHLPPKRITPTVAEQAAVYIVAHSGNLPAWSGSGSFIRGDLIATAGHVCDEDHNTLVQTYDGVWHKAEVVVVWDEPDVCLLRTKKRAAPATLSLAPSSSLKVGAPVWYFGYPGRAPGLFYGHYTGHRDGKLLASVNGWFGASGSLLMREDGRVVGVLSTTRTGNGIVLGFATVEDLRAAVQEYDANCECSEKPADLLPSGFSWFSVSI